MLCPFRIATTKKIFKNPTTDPAQPDIEKTSETFEDCMGSACPYHGSLRYSSDKDGNIKAEDDVCFRIIKELGVVGNPCFSPTDERRYLGPPSFTEFSHNTNLFSMMNTYGAPDMQSYVHNPCMGLYNMGPVTKENKEEK